MSDERRRSPRIELLGQIHGRVVPYDVAVTVRNISLGGVSLESAFPFPVGAVHSFRLLLGDGSSVELRGTIRRCLAEPGDDGETRYITGVQFSDADTDTEPGLPDLLGKLA